MSAGPLPSPQLFTFVPTASNAPYYLDILCEKEFARRAIKVAEEIISVAMAAHSAKDSQGLPERVSAALSSITQSFGAKSASRSPSSTPIRSK